MYTSLLDAPVNTDLSVLEVTSPVVYTWLQRMGVFEGGVLTKHDKEINYYPVRVRADKGEVVVPAGLAIKIFVHTNDDAKKPLVDMERNQVAHIESMSCGQGCINALRNLGFEDDTEVTFIRALPHMDYITVIDRRERTRLSEGEAARIWGQCEGEEPNQFYFSKRNKIFRVSEIIGGKKITKHLLTHGVQVGTELMLESIEQVQQMHAPKTKHITVTSPGGLRLYLNPMQAGQIIVKTLTQTEDNVLSGRESDEKAQG